MLENSHVIARTLRVVVLAALFSAAGPLSMIRSDSITGPSSPKTLSYTFQIENRTGRSIHVYADLNGPALFDFVVPWTPRADPNNPDGPPDSIPYRIRRVTVELPVTAGTLDVAETDAFNLRQAFSLLHPPIDAIHDFRIVVFPDHIELHQDLARGVEVPANPGSDVVAEALKERQEVPNVAILIGNRTGHSLKITAFADDVFFFRVDIPATLPARPATWTPTSPDDRLSYPHVRLSAPLRYGHKKLIVRETAFYKNTQALDFGAFRRDSDALELHATPTGFVIPR